MFGIENSNLKKSILQEIYVDNLKVAGKHVDENLPTEPAAAGRSLRVLLFFLTLMLVSLSGLATSLTVDEHLIEVKDPSATAKKEDRTTSTVEIAEPDTIEMLMAEWEDLSFQIPSKLFNQIEKQKFYDYSLLVPQNDQTRVSSLFGLGIKTIVIDPGHGGKDPGAIGTHGTREKDVTLDVALRLKQRIANLNRFNVLLTRETDKFLTLADRVDFARQKAADLFISIHVNSLPNETVNLIETYYFGPPLTSETFKLAQKENQDSHFSVSELEGIIQDIGNTVKRQESKMLAGAIQYSLYKHLKNQDPEVINSGVKMAPFVVLSQIEIPSVLVEISCITNENEEAKLKLPKYREKIASYIDEGIVAYLDLNYFKAINGE